MRISGPSPLRQNLLCASALGLLFLSAPFPQVQTVLHALLVLGLAPRSEAPLAGALWALTAGWIVEGTLRLLPHLGGTAWADLTLVLFAGWMAGRWPLEGLRGWLLRLAGLSVLHFVAVHAAVALAAGPHPWGWGWFYTLLSLPLWGWLSWRLLYVGPATGRR